MKLVLPLVACVAAPLAAQLRPIAQGNRGPVIAYEISFPNAVHHEAEVKATFTALPAGPLHARMARSSTGRYALHEYAKNVYGLNAVNSKGRALTVTRPDAYGWDVADHDGTVTVTYTLFADRADGTYSGFDLVQAHVQPQGTFLYARGLESRPVRVTFHRPDPKWTIATQLEPTGDPETFNAPGMQYLFDSPTHLGAMQWREWKEASGGRPQLIRAAVDDPATREAVDAYAEGVRKIVREAAAVFGELPEFDFGTYTFVACYRPGCNGDGMEHRNSTSVTSGASMGTTPMGVLGTVSHEFFHSWNVKRIRPRDLEPFDYDRANMSSSLWLAEGFTSYYGPLVMARAGLTSSSHYARGLSGAVNTLTNAPGRRFFSAVGMSQQAPFVDAAVSIDPQNKQNTFISYYTYGEAIALALDLSLRARGPHTLDDFLRAMWVRHGRPEIAYTLEDVRRALALASGDAAFANDFFARYIAGQELPDYGSLLEQAGMLVRKAQAGAPWIGDPTFSGSGRIVISSAVLIGSPLYVAGLERGDRLMSIDGAEAITDADVRRAVSAHKPGDRLTVVFEGRAGRREAQVAVAEDPRVEVVLFEDAGRTPSADQLAFRARWLASRQ
jgi:predicted metalloprotease with PDZ domain